MVTMLFAAVRVALRRVRRPPADLASELGAVASAAAAILGDEVAAELKDAEWRAD